MTFLYCSLRKNYFRFTGFALVELMIVVVVIGIIVSIAVPQFVVYRNKSRIASAVASAESVRAAIASYAVNSKGNTFPREILNYNDLMSVINAHGGSLKEEGSEPGYIFRAYTAYDIDNDSVIEHYTMSFLVMGIPVDDVGSAMRLSPAGVEKIVR